jgi:(p)ppGpp synthase/HD superfamily hydrolase
MAMHNHLTTTQIPERLPDSRRELTVRAKIHVMRVAAVWQVLMCIAGDIENIRVATNQSQEYEEITISFAPTSFESLEAIVDRIKKMPWVVDTMLC